MVSNYFTGLPYCLNVSVLIVTWKDLLNVCLKQQRFIKDCMFQDTTVQCVSPERYNVTAARSLEVNAVINCTLLKFIEIMPFMSHCRET